MPRHQKKHLPRNARKAKAGGIVGAVSIHERPAHINDRSTFGHWEGDGVSFRCKHRPNVTTLIKRQSRFVCLRYNRDRTTAVVMPAIIKGMRAVPANARRRRFLPAF